METLPTSRVEAELSECLRASPERRRSALCGRRPASPSCDVASGAGRSWRFYVSLRQRGREIAPRQGRPQRARRSHCAPGPSRSTTTPVHDAVAHRSCQCARYDRRPAFALSADAPVHRLGLRSTCTSRPQINRGRLVPAVPPRAALKCRRPACLFVVRGTAESGSFRRRRQHQATTMQCKGRYPFAEHSAPESEISALRIALRMLTLGDAPTSR